MSWRSRLRPWIPPALLHALRRRRGWGWSGDHGSWSAAQAAAGGSGYADPSIAGQVERAVQEVLAGRAAFERDGVAFAEPDARWPCLAALQHVRSACGNLRVLDVGGSLASVWLQHRSWLDGPGLRWLVAEQPTFATAGARAFPSGPPEFTSDLAGALDAGPWDAVLVSNALQYMPDADSVLAGIAQAAPAFLILDRLALTARDRDRFMVQKVPSHIYDATYACRFFAQPRIDAVLSQHWRELARWEVDADLPGADDCHLGGRFLARRA